MGDQNLRVWPIEGDGYGEVTEYPRNAKYRMEPHFVGATGAKQTDLVVFERDDKAENGENELGRHTLSEILLVYPGQPTPPAVSESEDARRSTVTSGRRKTPAKAGTVADKK